jgi:hypothetical protein
MADLPPIKVFNLIVSFQGIVDLIHEDGAPWIVAPDVTRPTELALHEEVLKEDDELMIEPHVPKLYVRGEIVSGNSDGNETPCHRTASLDFFDIAGRTISFEGTFVDPALVADRTPRAAATPNPGDERSLLWMPDLTALSQGKSLRSGLADGTAKHQQRPIVSSSVKLERGTLVTEGCWRMTDNAYWKATFDGNPATARALSRSIALVAPLEGDAVTIRMKPFDASGVEKTIVLAPVANENVVEVLISNHPLRCGLDGPRDFAAHYVLRDGSETMSAVPLPVGPVIAPGTDPQCSPGDNP